MSPGRSLVLYAGTLVGATAAGWWLLAAGVAPSVVSVVCLAAMIAWVALLQELRPTDLGWRRAFRLDLTHTVFSSALPDALLQVGLVALAARLASGGGIWPTSWPLAAQLLLAVAVGDLAFYALHRWAHEAEWLWPWHAIHHTAEELHMLAGGRNHPFAAAAVYACQLGFLILAGASEAVVTLAGIVVVTNGYLQHSAVAFSRTGLDRWWATAAVHRVHHAAERSVCNANYSGNLLVWDRLWGTYRAPSDSDPPAGLPGEPIPPRYLDHLRWPFSGRARPPRPS